MLPSLNPNIYVFVLYQVQVETHQEGVFHPLLRFACQRCRSVGVILNTSGSPTIKLAYLPIFEGFQSFLRWWTLFTERGSTLFTREQFLQFFLTQLHLLMGMSVALESDSMIQCTKQMTHMLFGLLPSFTTYLCIE